MATLKGVDNPKEMSEVDYYLHFLPLKYIETDLLEATNEQLEANGKKKCSLPEFKCWLGIWLQIYLHPGYKTEDFFSKEPRTMYWHPPYLGDTMSGNRFRAIHSCLTLTQETPPTYRDRFFWVRPLIKAFNDETKDAFNVGWLVVVDESMVAFMNKYAPGWTVVKRKPRPMGNEYHTTGHVSY